LNPQNFYGRKHSQSSGWRAAAEKRNRQGPAEERNRPHQSAAQADGCADNQASDTAAGGARVSALDNVLALVAMIVGLAAVGTVIFLLTIETT